MLSPPTSSLDTRTASKKLPRTVHIDVYCTGSDVEETSSECSDSSSSTSLKDRLHEDESNSTPQTVFDSNQMKLHHIRKANKEDLPRRIVVNNQQELNQYQKRASGNLRQYLLEQCDSKDEVNESKQILFDKHIGDQHQGHVKSGRFLNSRNRFNFRRDHSDDCISSNYPNSSRSTVRDFTCSSVSSMLAASNSAINEDLESSWKETDVLRSIQQSNIAPSDSFEYKNKRDRWRIRQMDQPESKIMHDSIEETDDSYLLKQNDGDIFENISETDPITAFDNLVKSLNANQSQSPRAVTPVLDVSPSNAFNRGVSLDKDTHKLQQNPSRKLFFAANTNTTTKKQTTSIPSIHSGYTREHLLRASKFGSVIDVIRKPGHHVGPAKNPDCQCEHCRRWFADRESVRQRASSLGSAPYKRSTFWISRRTMHLNN